MYIVQEMYPDSDYAFCPVCRVTCQPVFFETPDSLQIVCPNCLPQKEAVSVTDGPPTCVYVDCNEEGLFECKTCSGNLCLEHRELGGICSDCFDKYAIRQWGGHFGGVD